MASIKKRGDSYLITVSLGRDSTGKQILKSKTYKPTSKGEKAAAKEVNAFACKWEDEVRNGENIDVKITVDKLYEDWKQSKFAKKLSVRVYEDTCKEIEKYFMPTFRGRSLISVKKKDLQDIIDNMTGEDGQQLASSTIKRRFASFHAIFRYAIATDLIKNDPFSNLQFGEPTVQEEEVIHCFDASQCITFLSLFEKPIDTEEASEASVISINDYMALDSSEVFRLMYRAYFNLAILTGARRSELHALTWGDIDFMNGILPISKAASLTKEGVIIKGTKSKASKRVYHLDKAYLQILNDWKNMQKKLSVTVGSQWLGYAGADFDKNYIFTGLNGKMLYLTTMGSVLKKYITAYNKTCENEVDMLPFIRLHDLRHTTVSNLFDMGADSKLIANYIGHSDDKITKTVYLHTMKSKETLCSDLMSNALGKKA